MLIKGASDKGLQNGVPWDIRTPQSPCYLVLPNLHLLDIAVLENIPASTSIFHAYTFNTRSDKMHTKTVIAGAAIAALSLIPSCPAPVGVALVTTGSAAPIIGSLTYLGVKDGAGKKW